MLLPNVEEKLVWSKLTLVKKLLGIVVLGLLLSGNANAASDEKCSKRSSIASTEFSAKQIYWGCKQMDKQRVKCGIRSANAQTEFSAKQIYWGCKQMDKLRVKCGIKSQRAKSDFSAKKTYWSCRRS